MQFAILQLFLFLRLPEIVVDAGNHLGGEASLMGGVAQLGELMGEITIEIDPTLEFLPSCVWCQGGSVTEGQLCAAVVFVYLFHTTKLLKINELCTFLYTETRRHRVLFRTQNYFPSVSDTSFLMFTKVRSQSSPPFEGGARGG